MSSKRNRQRPEYPIAQVHRRMQRAPPHARRAQYGRDVVALDRRERASPGAHASGAATPPAIVMGADPDLLLSPAAPRRPGAAAPSQRTALPASTRFRAAPR